MFRSRPAVWNDSYTIQRHQLFIPKVGAVALSDKFAGKSTFQ